MSEYSEYVVLSYESKERLDKEVKELQNKGFVKDGNLMVDTVNGGNSYTQCMYKVL